MTGREFSEALRSGRRVYGTLIVSPSPRWCDVIASCGLDFVFIDTEHVALGRETLSWMCHAYRGQGLPPLVRIPSPDPYAACMVLDGGACGVIAPYVESAEQVRQLRGAVKLRPLKGRRLERILAGQEQCEDELAAYVEARNADNVLVVNVESVPAMEALEEIVAVPGLDGVLIGPHDLSTSLGIPEQYDHPRFDEAVRHIIATSRRFGVGVGIHFWGGMEQEIAWARHGANLLIHSTDLTLFQQACRRDLAEMRAALGDGSTRGGGEVSI